MSLRHIRAFAVLFSAVLATSAWANPGTGFTWSYQTTSLSPTNGYQYVVAMRNGQAWPVVINDAYATGGGSGYGNAATLFPAGSGSTSPSTNWQNIGSGFFANTPNRLRAATGPDGRVAFAGSDSSGVGMGGRVSAVTGGWGALPAGTKAVAFDTQGNLYTATNNSVSGVGGFPTSSYPISDMAVSPTGDVGVVTQDLKYWQYSAWTGGWSSTTLSTSYSGSDTADLAFDSLGRPHVIVNSTSYAVTAYDFSTVTGTWTTSVLATNLYSSSSHVTLAANANGTVGTAWVDSNGNLVYAYKHDLDNWASSIVTATGSPSSTYQVGIAYDYANLPVLAYRTTINTSAVMLAYDPITVPEPASIALACLAAGALAVRRPRR